MEKKAVSGIMLILLLTSMFMLASDVQQIRAESIEIEVYSSGFVGVDMAFDTFNNLYVAGRNGNIYKVVSGGGAPSIFVSSEEFSKLFDSGHVIEEAWGIAFDGVANLYVSTTGRDPQGTSFSAIFKIPLVNPVPQTFHVAPGWASRRSLFVVSNFLYTARIDGEIDRFDLIEGSLMGYHSYAETLSGLTVIGLNDVYATDTISGTVRKIDFAAVPTPKDIILVSGLSSPKGITHDSTRLYIVSGGQVSIAPVTGGTPSLFVASPLSDAQGVKIHDGFLYVTDAADSGKVYKVSLEAVPPAVADSFRLPLDEPWTKGRRFGKWYDDWKGYHLGEDMIKDYEAPVYALANGVVKHNDKKSGYGYVIVIEHEMMDGTFVCSVLGHLREGGAPVGLRVTKGQIVGYLSSLPEESGGIIHVHLGIRKGQYSTEPDIDGKWRYRGYGPAYIVDYWYPPYSFIEYYNLYKKAPVAKMEIKLKSPADLIVTDPEGITITKDIGEVPGMFYMELDIDENGKFDDIVTIWERKTGNYLITVTPEPYAEPTDTYTLEVWADGIITFLVENVQISNIPTQPYIIRSTETEVIPIIPTTVDFNPDTLNLKSKGEWVTVYIELPVGHGCDVSQIDVSSVRLNCTVPALAKPTEIGDYDGDGIPDLMVKFDIASVIALFSGKTVPGNYVMEVTGTVASIRFKGTDTIRVISPP